MALATRQTRGTIPCTSTCVPADPSPRHHHPFPHRPRHSFRIELNFPFAYRHGEATFPKWNTAVSKGIMLLHDPDGHIRWENGADIQVAYKVPDGTWETPKAELGGASYKSARVLTGRDFDVEGFAMINHTYGALTRFPPLSPPPTHFRGSTAHTHTLCAL